MPLEVPRSVPSYAEPLPVSHPRPARRDWWAVALAAVGLAVTALLLLAGVSSAAPVAPRARVTMAVGDETLTLDVLLLCHRPRIVNGPIAVTVTMPAGMSGAVTSQDSGFNNKGYTIRFANTTATDGPVTFAVRVPAITSRCATEVGVAAASGYALAAPGTTNAVTELDILV